MEAKSSQVEAAPAGQGGNGNAQPAPAQKRTAPTQGELVSKVMIRSDQPLVDIGINLTNEAFHKVSHVHDT